VSLILGLHLGLGIVCDFGHAVAEPRTCDGHPRAVKAADASVALWLCRAGNFLFPRRPGNQQRKRNQHSQTRISRSRWAGRQLGCPCSP